MNLEQATEKTYNAVNTYGLTNTLYTMFGKRVKIRVTFSKKDCDTPIEELSLSVRSYNALKRAGLDSIGKVVDALSEERITKIRNLGGKSIAEIQVKVNAIAKELISGKTPETLRFADDWEWAEE